MIYRIAGGLILLCVLVSAGYFFYETRRALTEDDHVIILDIQSGSKKDIVHTIQSAGIPLSGFLFRIASIGDDFESIELGERYVKKNISMRGLINILNKPLEKNKEKQIVIPEGWTISEIAEYLAEQNLVGASEFKNECGNIEKWSRQYSFLDAIPEGSSLEGFLFPDTYRVFSDTTAEAIVNKMLSTFKKKVIDSEILPIDGNEYIRMKIASILASEVKEFEDMKHVAGIISNRTKIGMPLQMDSTANYIIGSTRDRLSHNETKLDTPYNTYKYPGLPPTPISNPGLDAIRAAVTPEKNDYFFFLTDKKGVVYYARTHEEHIRNRNLYLGK